MKNENSLKDWFKLMGAWQIVYGLGAIMMFYSSAIREMAGNEVRETILATLILFIFVVLLHGILLVSNYVFGRPAGMKNAKNLIGIASGLVSIFAIAWVYFCAIFAIYFKAEPYIGIWCALGILFFLYITAMAIGAAKKYYRSVCLDGQSKYLWPAYVMQAAVVFLVLAFDYLRRL